MCVLALVGICVAVAWPHGSPLVPRNAGHPAGRGDRWAWIFLGCAAAALAVYAVGLLAVARRGIGRRTVLALALAIQLAPLGAPLLLSTDAWAYWDYGRIAAVHGANPYRQTPADYTGDPAYPHVGAALRHVPSVYGPGFTLASEPLALAAGSSAAAAAWIYKSLAALAILVAGWLAARRSPRPAFALAFVGWNPVLAIHMAGGGHNDALLPAFVLGALALAASGRRELAGVAWAAGALVKWVPLVFLPLRAVEARATDRRVGHLGFAATVALVAGVATWRYGWAWLHVFGPLAHNANRQTSFAIPHRLQQLGLPHGLAIGLCAAAFLCAYAWLLLEARRGRTRLGLAAALLLLATPYLAAWYVAWSIPLAAADDDRTAQLVSLGLCGYLLRQTVPL